MANIVPYSFQSDIIPQAQTSSLEGQSQAVHFTIGTENPDQARNWILSKIYAWFEDRDEVTLVDHGTTAKGLGYIVMEWEECEIDPLFLSILEHEDIVDDYTVYNRDSVYEEAPL